MNATNAMRRGLLLACGSYALLPHLTVAAGALPADSIYQLSVPLTDQRGRTFDLASRRGEVVLVSMFYSSCQMTCPMIFGTVQKIVSSLPAGERERVKVLMISFDPQRDTPEVLRKTGAARGCDANWTLARTDEASTRKIAAVLGVQYRRLADGDFNHSSVIALLDRDGRMAARTARLGSVDANLLQALQQQLGLAG